MQILILNFQGFSAPFDLYGKQSWYTGLMENSLTFTLFTIVAMVK
jgi:hypothetical protein